MSEEWFPTQGGTYTAYRPQFQEGDQWHDLYAEKANPETMPHAVPVASHLGNISIQLDLYGYEHAMAIAWNYSAVMAGYGKTVKVRVRKYRVKYDLRAQELEDEIEEVHKDQTPLFRIVERYSDGWCVNGKWFDHSPSEQEVEDAYCPQPAVSQPESNLHKG
jgi:hypothetical protein